MPMTSICFNKCTSGVRDASSGGGCGCVSTVEIQKPSAQCCCEPNTSLKKQNKTRFVAWGDDWIGKLLAAKCGDPNLSLRKELKAPVTHWPSAQGTSHCSTKCYWMELLRKWHPRLSLFVKGWAVTSLSFEVQTIHIIPSGLCYCVQTTMGYMEMNMVVSWHNCSHKQHVVCEPRLRSSGLETVFFN